MKPVLLLTVAALLFAQKAPVSADWVLTFVDEFEGRELDLTKWSPHDPLHAGYSAAKATVSGGQLHLASGAISSFGLFAQAGGRFEIRFKAPVGHGVRSRFHLLPVPLGPLPAIDVFEVDGDAPSKVVLGNHWGNEQTEKSYGDELDGPDFSAGFHTIAIEWDAEKIAWFVDGKEKFRSVDGIPRQPVFLVIDVSGPGAAMLDVDYIRLYRR
jgi:beta-glucanase (GH16 family)